VLVLGWLRYVFEDSHVLVARNEGTNRDVNEVADDETGDAHKAGLGNIDEEDIVVQEAQHQKSMAQDIQSPQRQVNDLIDRRGRGAGHPTIEEESDEAETSPPRKSSLASDVRSDVTAPSTPPTSFKQLSSSPTSTSIKGWENDGEWTPSLLYPGAQSEEDTIDCSSNGQHSTATVDERYLCSAPNTNPSELELPTCASAASLVPYKRRFEDGQESFVEVKRASPSCTEVLPQAESVSTTCQSEVWSFTYPQKGQTELPSTPTILRVLKMDGSLTTISSELHSASLKRV